ncbi:hypothetical protein TRVA0_017S01882 [Trichomonascus vanleenenianus]|uniref:uncharacterized protein n=1 Tax=Trichomonascus vanleenenianus TaxID=2268995 RepID=UPI003EC9C848
MLSIYGLLLVLSLSLFPRSGAPEGLGGLVPQELPTAGGLWPSCPGVPVNNGSNSAHQKRFFATKRAVVATPGFCRAFLCGHCFVLARWLPHHSHFRGRFTPGRSLKRRPLQCLAGWLSLLPIVAQFACPYIPRAGVLTHWTLF